MNIVVLIKQVPDTNEVVIDPATGRIQREGLPSIINPDDKAGIEEALKIKEANGAHVTVLTMGPPQAMDALKEAYAMGADDCVLLTDRAFGGADTWATSTALAGALNSLKWDLIIAGRQAIDGDTAQVGPQTAEHLGIPSISYVENIEEITDDSITVKRQYEDRYQILKAKFPVLITTLGEMNHPRYPRVSRIFDINRDESPIKTWTVNDIEVDRNNIGLDGSPTKVRRSFTKGAKGAGKIFDDVDPKQGANIIFDKLAEEFII